MARDELRVDGHNDSGHFDRARAATASMQLGTVPRMEVQARWMQAWVDGRGRWDLEHKLCELEVHVLVQADDMRAVELDMDHRPSFFMTRDHFRLVQVLVH